TGYWPGWEKYYFVLEAFRKTFFWVVFLPALAGILAAGFRRRLLCPEGADLLLLTLMTASLFLTLYLFLGDPRIRVTYDPLFFVMAADAVVGFFSFRRKEDIPSYKNQTALATARANSAVPESPPKSEVSVLPRLTTE